MCYLRYTRVQCPTCRRYLETGRTLDPADADQVSCVWVIMHGLGYGQCGTQTPAFNKEWVCCPSCAKRNKKKRRNRDDEEEEEEEEDQGESKRQRIAAA